MKESVVLRVIRINTYLKTNIDTYHITYCTSFEMTLFKVSTTLKSGLPSSPRMAVTRPTAIENTTIPIRFCPGW